MKKIHNVKYTSTLTNTSNTKAHIDIAEENNSAYKTLEDDTKAQNSTKEKQTLKAPKHISFTNTCTYTVELPISELWRPELKVAMKAEVKHLQDYETFMEVKNQGQTKVGSRWVITEKEQQNSQKTKVKARLVAQVFKKP